MPRPKTYTKDRIQLQVRLTTVLNKRLEKEAARRLVSKTYLVESALMLALDQWESQPGPQALQELLST